MKRAKTKKPRKSMNEITQGMKEFLKDKEQNPNNKKDFNNALKKAVKKQSAPK